MAKNPKKLTAYLYAYLNPVRELDFDYRVCSWYEEGKIVYSGYDKVVAYIGGYRVTLDIKIYRFKNVSQWEHGQRRLIRYCQARPLKYQGWLHHVNFYTQPYRGKGIFFKRIIL